MLIMTNSRAKVGTFYPWLYKLFATPYKTKKIYLSFLGYE